MTDPPRRHPHVAIVEAARHGKGLRLSPVEVARLAAEPGIAAWGKVALAAKTPVERAEHPPRLRRPACYGVDRHGGPLVRRKWLPVCRCSEAARRGPPGGVCDCGGAIPTPEEAERLRRQL